MRAAARRLLQASLAIACAAALAPASSQGAVTEGGLESRAWEMVSPALPGGGKVGAPGAGGGAFQAAADGEALAFGSAAAFAGGAGAPPVSQYVAARGAGGWSTANVSPPLLSGTYASGAYHLLSTDLVRGLLSSGWRCRDGGSGCAAENPPLDPAVPPGYRTLYLREAGSYRSLLTTTNSPALPAPPASFQLSLAGATPNLSHAVISTATDLYLWSDDGALAALNFLPGQPTTSPGAALAAPVGAIAADGSRVYFTHGGDLYLREGAVTKAVDDDAGGGGSFQAASADGSVAFFTAAGHLYRYDAAADASTDLTPGGGALGALGTSADGSRVYYLTASGLFLREGVTVVSVTSAADPANVPAATGTAHLTADGNRLAFVKAGQVYLYEAPADRLLCVSCNPNGTPPLGPSTLPAARAAAEGPAAYKPRALTADGQRLFFDSADALVAQDFDGLADAYQWLAAGVGGCGQPNGCLGLVSSGRSDADSFLDASADGRDAFFLTTASLTAVDRGGLDVYDARAGGGFPEPSPPVVCEGDGCQGIVLPRDDPAPGTARSGGLPNPPPRYVEKAKQCKKGFVRKKGRCVKKKAAKKRRGQR